VNRHKPFQGDAPDPVVVGEAGEGAGAATLIEVNDWPRPEVLMKTILVPVAGVDADAATLETARTVAQATASHVRFLHVRLDASEAALQMPHVSFAIGAGIRSALQMLNDEGAQRVAAAARRVSEFCAAWGIATTDPRQHSSSNCAMVGRKRQCPTALAIPR
jgi:hypothetical protein